MLEEEMEAELVEFRRAAILYRPMSKVMAMRFQPASTSALATSAASTLSPEEPALQAEAKRMKEEQDASEKDDKQAAVSVRFGLFDRRAFFSLVCVPAFLSVSVSLTLALSLRSS